MAKRPNEMKGAERVPTREEVLAFLKSGKTGKREIAKAFGIKGAARIPLKAMLKELESEGIVEKRGKHLHSPGQLPTMVLADITSKDRDGDLVARPVEWDAKAHGKPPVIHIHIGRARGPQPTVGDRVLLRVEPTNDSFTVYRGRSVKIFEKHKVETLGQFRAAPMGGGRVMPVDKKALGRDVMIPPGQEGDAEDGDLVAVTTHRKNKLGLVEGRVTERIGSIKSERAVSLIAIHTHNIPNVFPKAAIEEADAAKPASMRDGVQREDWRFIPLVTIDPADAKDHDDAVHAEPDPDQDGGVIVTVAIADVSAYVRQGSALDREARMRGNSVYFPDRVVPMLPENISNNLCSLRPDEDRPALAVRMMIAPDGRKISHSFHRILMRSHAKLAYEEAQRIIDSHDETHLAAKSLRHLWDAWAITRAERDDRAPLEIDLPERKLKLKEDGSIDRILVPPRLDAHRLIEDFMILANVAAAETLEKAQVPLIYRAHGEPSIEKIRSLAEVLQSIGSQMPRHAKLRSRDFNGILAQYRGSEHEHFVNEVVLRSQAQAEYTTDNYGHFGLHLRRYAHFTSPIRRYADLIVHRALIRACKLGEDGLSDASIPELVDIAAEISAAERRAMAAERETIERLIAFHLNERIGDIFEGRIAGVTRSGLFVKLFESGADGFVPAATIGADYYRYEEGLHALVGSRTGETYRLGDAVSVRLVEAAPVAGALRFELLSEGRIGGKNKLGAKRKQGTGKLNGPRKDKKKFDKPSQEPKARRRKR